MLKIKSLNKRLLKIFQNMPQLFCW